MIMPIDPLRAKLDEIYRADETTCVQELLQAAHLTEQQLAQIQRQALQFIAGIRERRAAQGGLDAFLVQYDLSSDEGVALMCLAEALLRIPDTATRDKLICDKLASGQWQEHRGRSHSMFVNAMTWGLMLTGKVITPHKKEENYFGGILKTLISRTGMPAIRLAVNHMMKILSQQFVMGQTIDAAIKRARTLEKIGYRYSYDMLGEAAKTQEDAERYFRAYQQAITSIARAATYANPIKNPGISIKLSALHPRYDYAQRERVIAEVTPRLLQLVQAAKQANINVTIDAEEADKLDLSLAIIEKVFCDPSLKDWEGFGLAVQSYQKRGFYLLDWLAQLARSQKRRLLIRLIKGAYWDSEIKQSQLLGLESYPVFTRKNSTDISFLACAKKIITMKDAFFPQFATHNAFSAAAVLTLMGNNREFEFQCLHGMGQPLYDQIVGEKNLNIPCRIYAPVGGYEDLLAYLVRRLLENGANTSFINRIVDESAPVAALVESPMQYAENLAHIPHPHISLPRHIYGATRLNSAGFDFSNQTQLNTLLKNLQQIKSVDLQAVPSYHTQKNNPPQKIVSPSDSREIIGTVINATSEEVDVALTNAVKAHNAWDNTPATERAQILEKTADLLEENRILLMSLAIREAGKTLPDAIAEVREAVDFCRYYANQARHYFSAPIKLPGPTGENNHLALHGRGVIACISPWNFPLAIFLGQVTAALAAGNCVVAKPAEQTPLIAAQAVKLLHQAGVPEAVVQLLPGDGESVGAKLVADLRISGVMFTGSTETARRINKILAERNGPIIPFIAETGGQNVMIVDSSALPEQVVRDVIISAFGSTGQRCSALRVLYLQEDVADKIIAMIKGAMAELVVGNPEKISTDVGPVIDQAALKMLSKHFQQMKATGKLLAQTPLTAECEHGYYFSPSVFAIDSIKQLSGEVFGPILHVIRYRQKELNTIIQEIVETGYGLTFGVHSRIAQTVNEIIQQMHVGNIYVNRSMIGAVVGVQPFGGEGLSGTGPKAGGPHYLLRLAIERVVTVDTTAAGGNATLLSLREE